jgi:hypothetical protein
MSQRDPDFSERKKWSESLLQYFKRNELDECRNTAVLNKSGTKRMSKIRRKKVTRAPAVTDIWTSVYKVC